MASSKLTTDSGLEDLLGKVAFSLRSDVLDKSAKDAIKPMVSDLRSRIPKGGPRIGSKAGKKHLRQTITYKTIQTSRGIIAIAGAAYPAGAHFHLYDKGFTHISGAQIPGKGVLIDSVNATIGVVNKRFETSIAKRVANP